jgi:hypothetical protein
MSFNDDRSSFLEPIRKITETTMQQHGATPRGMGWSSDSNQFQRFRQLCNVFEIADRAFSLNDLGCGVGHLFDVVDERYELSTYTGYEVSPEIASAARQRVTSPKAEFIVSDRITQKADFSVACGIFNTRLDNNDQTWTAYMKSVIMELVEQSRLGIGFTSLGIDVDWREPHLFYADPEEWFTWCRENISKRVSLINVTPRYEWVMCIVL